MKRVSCSLVVWLLLVAAVVLSHEALAGNCGPTGCPFVGPAPQPAPVAASSKHAFTAAGGRRVAEINLSQEAREVITAEGKETPLPKGFLSAADRAKLIATQVPLYGWPQDQARRPVSLAQSRDPTIARISQNSRDEVQSSKPELGKKQTAVKVAVATKTKSRN